ncbi:MAG: flagellar basal body rod protein FlgC [Planctomycetota bacterium]
MDALSSLFGGLRTASSGMSAERAHIDVIAKNLAHAQVTRMPDGSGPYRRQIIRFATVMRRIAGEKPQPEGVKVQGVETDMSTPLEHVYSPGHPDADASGMVAYPNVNPTAEMAELITAVRAYESNANAADGFVKMAERALRMAQ